jgi:hypothetical protein
MQRIGQLMWTCREVGRVPPCAIGAIRGLLARNFDPCRIEHIGHSEQKNYSETNWQMLESRSALHKLP